MLDNKTLILSVLNGKTGFLQADIRGGFTGSAYLCAETALTRGIRPASARIDMGNSIHLQSYRRVKKYKPSLQVCAPCIAP